MKDKVLANQDRLTRREAVSVVLSAGAGRILPSAAQTTPVGHLNYHPAGLYVWDTWYFTRGDEIHVIHLQQKRPDSSRPDRDRGALGHAVSTDLLTWQELPAALYRGPAGSVDDLDLFTGCTIFHEDRYWLFYTARSSKEQGRIQRICLATSPDAITWSKYPQPVIEPDPRWYTNLDCRDLMVHRHPETGEFHGFYAASRPKHELVDRPVIAHARSRDLIHWTQEPPALITDRYGVLEVPDIFYLQGKWWMICATGNFDGVRGGYHDRWIVYGTVCASSERLEGPYEEHKGDVILGSMEFNGFTCRSVVWKGQRYALYTQAERRDRKDGAPPTLGCLTTPKHFGVSSTGQLQMTYCPIIEKRTRNLPNSYTLPGQLIASNAVRFGTPGVWQSEGRAVNASSPHSWSVRYYSESVDSFIFTARVTLHAGRSVGLVFRETLAVVLDYAEQCILFADLPWFRRLDSHDVPLELQREYRICLVTKGEFCEVYLDDVLILAFVRYEPARGRLGLFVEAGNCLFSDLSVLNLIV